MMQVPMILTLLAVTAAGTGSWSLLRNWRKLVETQLRLDGCVREAAWDLSDWVEEIDRSNREIEVLRASLLAGIALPPVAQAARAALQVEELRQESIRLRWEAWRLSGGTCKELRDRWTKFPRFPYAARARDPIGPLPLDRDSRSAWPLTLQLDRKPRASAAVIVTGEKGATHARWTAPL